MLVLHLKVGQGFDKSVNFSRWQPLQSHFLARRHLFMKDLPLKPHDLRSVMSMGEGGCCYVLLKELWQLWHFASKVLESEIDQFSTTNTWPGDDLVLDRDASPYCFIDPCRKSQ